jgi:tRNA 2-thiouridine synthesizing protein B
MNTLHLLAHSPFNDSRLDSCLPLLADGDGLLLSGDAVYALQPGSPVLQTLQQLSAGIMIHALQEDLLARGLNQPPERITVVDYPAFVELCTQYSRVNSWL